MDSLKGLTVRCLFFVVLVVGFFCFALKPLHAFEYVSLPSDNLIKNPWFRNTTGRICKFSLENWKTTANAPWKMSDKTQDPTDVNCVIKNDDWVGFAARFARNSGANPEFYPNKDALLWQVVGPVDETKTTLDFHFLFVAHRVNKYKAEIYGSNGPNGPWTSVWTPLNIVNCLSTDCVNNVPGGVCNTGNRQCLWDEVTDYYLGSLDPVSTTIPQGYQYYKIEFLMNYPNPNSTETGDVGGKAVRVYFNVKHSPTPTPTELPPTPTLEPTPTPEDTVVPTVPGIPAQCVANESLVDGDPIDWVHVGQEYTYKLTLSPLDHTGASITQSIPEELLILEDSLPEYCAASGNVLGASASKAEVSGMTILAMLLIVFWLGGAAYLVGRYTKMPEAEEMTIAGRKLTKPQFKKLLTGIMLVTTVLMLILLTAIIRERRAAPDDISAEGTSSIICEEVPAGVTEISFDVIAMEIPENQTAVNTATVLSSGETSVCTNIITIMQAVPTETPVPTDTPEPTPTETPVPTETPLPTDTPEPTIEPTETPVPTDTPEPTPTETPVPTDTPLPTPTETPLPTDTPLPSDTPVPTDTPEPTVEPTEIPIPTDTIEPSEQPTPTPEDTVIPTIAGIAAQCLSNMAMKNDIPVTEVYVGEEFTYRLNLTPPDHTGASITEPIPGELLILESTLPEYCLASGNVLGASDSKTSSSVLLMLVILLSVISLGSAVYLAVKYQKLKENDEFSIVGRNLGKTELKQLVTIVLTIAVLLLITMSAVLIRERGAAPDDTSAESAEPASLITCEQVPAGVTEISFNVVAMSMPEDPLMINTATVLSAGETSVCSSMVTIMPLTLTETPEPSPEPTEVPLPTDTPEPSESPVPTETPEPTVEPTEVPVPTDTPEPTNTPMPTDTPEPTATETPVPTDTPVPTETPEPTLEPTDTPIPTDTPVPTDTPEPTEEPTPTPEDTVIPTMPGIAAQCFSNVALIDNQPVNQAFVQQEFTYKLTLTPSDHTGANVTAAISEGLLILEDSLPEYCTAMGNVLGASVVRTNLSALTIVLMLKSVVLLGAIIYLTAKYAKLKENEGLRLGNKQLSKTQMKQLLTIAAALTGLIILLMVGAIIRDRRAAPDDIGAVGTSLVICSQVPAGVTEVSFDVMAMELPADPMVINTATVLSAGETSVCSNAVMIMEMIPTDTPIPTDTLTPIPTETLVPTETPIPTETPMPTQVPEPTSTPIPSVTPTPTRAPGATAKPTNTPRVR